MTNSDRQRAVRALQADWDNLDELRDAVRALQSTDAPCLLPIHDYLMKRLKELETRVRPKYVLGFAVYPGHTPHDTRVVLIRKNRPAAQAGKLNGVGGRVEVGETLLAAMVREFEQETWLRVDPSRWTHFAEIISDAAEITCYTCELKPGERVATRTDEAVNLYHKNNLDLYDMVQHTPWLIHLALDKTVMPVKAKTR